MHRIQQIAPARCARPVTVEPLETRCLFSGAVWTGGAGDGQWSNPANWQGDQLPASGQDIDLPSISGAPVSITLSSAVTVGNLTFGGGYYLQGAPITLDGNVYVESNIENTISNAVLGHNVTIDVTFSNALSLINPSDGGHGYGITETTGDHVGFVYIYGSSASYTGTTVVASGLLEVDCALPSRVQVDSGATLDGNGTVAGVVVEGGGGLAGGVDPGDPYSAAVPAGGISSSSGVMLAPGANLGAGFPTSDSPDSPPTASEFQGLSVAAGPIDLSGSTLSTGEAPGGIPEGTVLTLISNSTGHPVSGTFAGLPQGAVEDGYRINYAGGTNHQDVTLAVLRPITVTSAAHASPNVITGNSSVLTALGTTSTGQSGLTYHWAVVASPPGAPKPRFSTNGSAAARRSVVTFGKAGYYRLRCTISDGTGDSAASDVSVRVEQVATSLRLRPLHATVIKGSSIAIKSTELDEFGDPLAEQGTPAFSILTGPGTINATTGVFSSTLIGTDLIEATDDHLSGTVGLQVIPS